VIKEIRSHVIGPICMGFLLFLAGVLVGLRVWNWQEIDRCLDHSERWDYKIEVCVLT
jgi:hypothetical protein